MKEEDVLWFDVLDLNTMTGRLSKGQNIMENQNLALSLEDVERLIGQLSIKIFLLERQLVKLENEKNTNVTMGAMDRAEKKEN